MSKDKHLGFAFAPEMAADPQAKGEFEWILVGLKAKTNPPRVDEKTMTSYAGVYGERKVMFESGVLWRSPISI